MLFNDVELRVLGVLIEKSLTHPGGYPITLNAIVLGANQKQNREPVVEHKEGEVAAALHTLQLKKLVAQAPPALGARSVRFEHKVVEVFHWDRREQAVMAELLLRGRQTVGELRTRALRMTSLPDLVAVGAVLDQLKSGDPPFVEELPREPGRSANRFRHLLSADPPPVVQEPVAVHAVAAADSGLDEANLNASAALAVLAGRIAQLETDVADLKAVVARITPRP